MHPRVSHCLSALFTIVTLPAAASLEAQRTPRQELAPPASQSRIDTLVYSRLRYRYIGPEGNRVTSVAGVPGDPTVYYAGAASGGLWKTTDAGVHWTPIFDGQPVSSIGSLAVAPSEPNIVWAGTGEPYIRSNISIGWGMFKSTDAGKTWARAGLENTGRISRVIVHPTNPDVVYVASEGHAYGPQQERGIYRTSDGGKTWERVLFVNDSVGASDLVMDPTNPRVLFAGMWQIEVHTWGRTSGGAGSSLWMTRDGGTTWKRLTAHGLPEKPYGKVGLAMSKANPQRVYALIETGDGVPRADFPDVDSGRLFRSDDGGESWQLVSSDRQVAGRTHYYNRMAAMPDNADEAYFATASWAKTLDGGRTIIDPPPAEQPAGDHHDIWIDPTNGNRMIVSHDDGLSITANRGKSWWQIQLPLAQMYHVAVDNRIPYNVYGNRQDGPSAMGPSNAKTNGDGEGSITRGMWRTVGGGESGWATPDPVDTNLVWSSASGFGSEGGIVTRYDIRTGIARSVEVWPEATTGWPADSLKYRFVWTFPVTLSPHDHNTLYVGSQHVHRTTDGGVTWREISPDLTRNDKSRQRRSGGLTPDDIGVEYAGVVFAIAESPKEKGLLWVGTNDGLVQISRDAGATWTNVTANIPGIPTWGTVSNIEPSRYAAGTAYLTVDGHQVNNRDPWVYKTTDYGKTWKLIVDGLPRNPLAYAHCVREDPARPGLLYLGTENGLYVSMDDGAHWQSLQNNLPHAPVYWLTVQEHFNDLVVATYGRGFWILDDITPLRALAAGLPSTDAHLFAPRETYRLRDIETSFAARYDPTAGQNPHYGAPINYWLRSNSADTLKDSVTIKVADASGAVVRTLRAPQRAGINRVYWDLQGERTKEARLRTSPLYAPWVSIGLEGKPAPGVGRWAILEPPGSYTVTLSFGGTDYSQPLVVRKDPNSGGSEDDIRTQVAAAQSIRTDVDQTVDMINRVEVVRGQLVALKNVIAGDSSRRDVGAAADSLDKKLVAVEENLLQVRTTGRGQDLIRWPSQLAEKLLYLAGSVSGSDYAPTSAQKEVQGLLHQRVLDLKGVVDALLARDVVAFNEMLRKRNLQNIITA